MVGLLGQHVLEPDGEPPVAAFLRLGDPRRVVRNHVPFGRNVDLHHLPGGPDFLGHRRTDVELAPERRNLFRQEHCVAQLARDVARQAVAEDDSSISESTRRDVERGQWDGRA